MLPRASHVMPYRGRDCYVTGLTREDEITLTLPLARSHRHSSRQRQDPHDEDDSAVLTAHVRVPSGDQLLWRIPVLCSHHQPAEVRRDQQKGREVVA